MKLRHDTILASFIVAVFSSFLISLAMLLLTSLSIALFDRRLFADITVSILILIFFGAFIFFKGSALAAWLLYRRDVPWGYKLEVRRIFPIFIISFAMAMSIFFAVYFYSTGKLTRLAYLQYPLKVLERGRM